MSTNDLPGGVSDFDSVIDLTGSKAAAAAGMPDPAELARLAAEFYGTLPNAAIPDTPQVPAMPGTPALPGTPSTAGMPNMPSTASLPSMPSLPDVQATQAAPALPAMSLPPAFAFLGDVRGLDDMARVPGLPAASLSDWGSTPSESQLRSAAAMTPAMPGVQSIPWMGNLDAIPNPAQFPATPDALDMTSVPAAFAFLGDVRAIEDITRVPGLPAASLSDWGSTPSESQLRSAAAMTPAMPGVQSIPWMGDSQIAPHASQLAVPQIPGAVTPLPDSLTDPASFGFIEFVRPLELPGGAPVGGAIPTELGGFGASDLSSIPFDVGAIRRDFPILQESFNGRPLIWLDNAATTQKPQAVIDRLAYFYAHENSNVHRAAHQLAARATDAYEAARETVRRFLNASSTREIVFVRGTTEGINLIAQSWGRRNVRKDDEIVITWLEHHANIVPWQMLCAETGAKLRVAPVDDGGQVLLDEYERLLGPRTKIVSFSHVSNALGTVTPVEQMIAMAHRHGAKVVVDGAQSVAHTRVDVQQYDCDFFVFSGHKIFAPTGVGVVYGKSELLEHMPPWQGGGNMIKDVTFEKTVYNEPPVRFEAGTGTIADAVGLGAALDYVSRIGLPNIAAYEHDLLAYGTEVLRRVPGLRLIGTAPEKASVLSFVIDGYRTEDIGAALAREGIAVRAGHHCAQPILRRFGLESTVRPSLAFYNTCEEIDALGAALRNLKSGWLR
jgi:cysteine desulfurase/selenocysteine lyase